jgi:uncharacterized protein YecE (DUF72 family)
MYEILIGCCGFPVSFDRYLECFNVVEIQKTFYKPPKPETAFRWRDKTNERSFEFTVKAWQLITHPSSSPTYRKAGLKLDGLEKAGFFRPVKIVFDAWEKTKEIAEILGARKIIFQTPVSFRESEENISNMREFFTTISDKKFSFIWEPRGWKKDSVYEVCKELNLVHCADPFVTRPSFGEFYYLRLHGGHKKMYSHKYTTEELQWLYNFLINSGREKAYVLFNNKSMFEDAFEFKRVLSKI